MNVQQILAQNENYWASISNFELTFNVDFKMDDEKKYTKKIDGIWIKQNNIEKVSYAWSTNENISGVIEDGTKESYFFDGDRTYIYSVVQKEIENKKLTPCIPLKGLSAKIMKGKHDLIVPAPNLLDKLRFPSSNESKYLSQIFPNCQTESIEKTTNNNGDKLCTINLKEISSDTETTTESSIFVINCSKNFLIDSFQIIEYYKSSRVHRKLQVLEYKEFDTGQWIPSKIEIDVRDENDKLFSKTIIQIESFSTTLNMKKELFGFFPSNILVPEADENGKVIAIHIWGDNNKPAFTFTLEKEFESYMEKHCAGTLDKLVQSPFPWSRIVMFLAGILMILFVIYFKRRKIKR
jgi:hypothetical protein